MLKKAYIGLIILALAAVVAPAGFLVHAAAPAVPGPLASTAAAGTELPGYVRVGGEEWPAPDSLFYALAGCTIYPVNGVHLRPESQLCAELQADVLPLARREGWRLEAIELRGAASPEGPYLNNQWLAERRAQALYDYMRQQLPLDATIDTRIVTVPEDYGYLLWLLQRQGDGAAPVLEELIRRHPDDPQAIKAAMVAVADGAMWRRLVADYYPYLRNARVMLYFSCQRPHQQLELPVPEPARLEVAPLAAAERPRPVLPLGLMLERRHALSLSTNALYDAFYMPGFGWAPLLNINAEFYPRCGHFTYRLGFTSPYYHRWDRHKFFQIRDYHLEVRRYFDPGLLHTGTYLAVYANANKYGIGLGPTRGWKGEGAGAAVKLGYVLPLGSGRWRLDLHIAAGAYYTRFDPYVWGDPINGDPDGYYYDYTGPVADFHRRNHRRWWLGPTEAGVTLTFDILYHKRAGGLSCRRKEVVLP